MIQVAEAIAFLKRQDPEAVLILERDGDDQNSPDVLAAPGGPIREEVKRIVAQESWEGEDQKIVIFQ